MLSIVKSMSLEGVNGYFVEIQIDVSGGLPSFDIVGLPDIRVKEAKERVRTAIKNTRGEFPSRKIVVNLAPADKRKEGTFFDLPIAVGILCAIGELSSKKLEDFSNTIFLGELCLDGKVNSINGVLPMCIEAVNLGIKRMIIPKENYAEASIIKDIEIIGVENLEEVIGFIEGRINRCSHKNQIKFNNRNFYNVDYSEVKGQENAKRALEIAAARFTQLSFNPEIQVQEKHVFLRGYLQYYLI